MELANAIQEALDKTSAKAEPGEEIISAQEYRARQAKGEKMHAEIKTYWGRVEIDGISESYWAHSSKANGGFGQSFSLHAGSEIIVKGR